MCVFIVRLYVRARFTAHNAIAVHYHDLQFLQTLKRQETFIQQFPRLLQTSFKDTFGIEMRSWLIALALFDPVVPSDTKRAMVQAIVEDGEGIGIKYLKRINIAAETTEQAYLTMHVTKNSKRFEMFRHSCRFSRC